MKAMEGKMTHSDQDGWIRAISKYEKSIRNMEAILENIGDEKISDNDKKILSKKWYEQHAILMQSYIDIRSSMRAGTIIPGIENEDDFNLWRELVIKDKYTIMENLEYAWNHYVEVSEMEDPLGDPRESYNTVCAEMLKILIDFPFFKPDLWCKKEDEVKPLYIKGAGIPDWLSDRYREAVYSYIYGFNNAAIAMCRSIIEGILKNKYDINGDLKDMMEFHVKTIKDKKNEQVAWSTKKISILASYVLHDIRKSIKDSSAREALLTTRNFIKTIY
jgi:hypothetical protein